MGSAATQGLWRLYHQSCREGHLHRALEVASDAAADAHSTGDSLRYGIWLRKRAACLFMMGRYSEAIRAAIRSHQVQRDDYEKSLSLITVGGYLDFIGKDDAALRYFDRADRLSGLYRSDVYLMSFLYGSRALALKHLGETDRAILDWEGAASLLCAAGQIWQAAMYVNNIGNLLVAKGLLKEAEQRLKEAVDLVELDPHLHTKAVISDSLGSLYVQKKDYRRALSFLRRAEQIFTDLDDQAQLVCTLIHLSEAFQKAALVKFDEDRALLIANARHEAARALARATDLRNKTLLDQASTQLDLVNALDAPCPAPQESIA